MLSSSHNLFWNEQRPSLWLRISSSSIDIIPVVSVSTRAEI